MDISSVIDGIERATAQRVKAEQGDYYGEDGLLYCHKCNTPKQCRLEILGETRTPMCLCKCEVERRDKEEAERKRIEFQARVKKMRSAGFPEAEMQNWTFEHDDGESSQIISIARKYVENFDKMRKDGKGLLLFGGVGSGKTFASACIANALIDKGFPCMVTNFARIANTVQGMFDGKQAYYDSFNKYALLILDDLSAERKTEYMQEIVFNVIDSRYRAKLPTISQQMKSRILLTSHISAYSVDCLRCVCRLNAKEKTEEERFSRTLSASIRNY